MKNFIKFVIAVVLGHLLTLFLIKPIAMANREVVSETFGNIIYYSTEAVIILTLFYLMTLIWERDF